MIPTFLLLFAWLLAPPALAADEPDCSTPRSATDSVFDWLRPDTYAPAKAGTCFDPPSGDNAGRLAVQLKQVLDARGIYFPVAAMPEDPGTVDAQGKAVVVPLPDALPMIVLERLADGRWVFSRETCEAIPELYRDTFSAFSLWFQRQLPDSWHVPVLGLYGWQLLYAGLVFACALIVGLVARTLLRDQLASRLDRLGLDIGKAAVNKANGAVTAFVMLWLIRAGLPDLQLPISLSQPLMFVVTIGWWLAGLLTLHRFISIGADIAATWASRTSSRLDDQAIPLMRQGAQVVLIAVGAIYVADAMGFDVWQLAAGVGIGGIAFALAAQDTVANLFGSMNIFLDRPFQIGDWIKVDDVEGVVEEVGFRSTRVRTFHNSLVTIPNSQITNANVDNLGARPRRRVKMTVGLTYDTPPARITEYVQGLRGILHRADVVHDPPEVHVHALGPSAIEILVYYHVVTGTWTEELSARAEHILAFVELASEVGVSFAFPSTSVYVEALPRGTAS